MTNVSERLFFDFPDSERQAVVCDSGEVLSYAQLNCRVTEFLSRLPSSRQLLFIRAANSLTSLVAYLACLRAGHIALLMEEELAEEAEHTLLENYRPNYLVDGKLPLVEALHHLGDHQHKFHPQLALLLSTSGSTGSPKLVRLSRDNLQSNAQSIVDFLPVDENDTAITALPFCYSYGLSIINTHLLKGARLALTAEKPGTRPFWDLFRSAGVNSFSGVPLSFSMLRMMRFERLDLPGLRYLTCAGGGLDQQQRQYLAELSEAKQLPVYAMYGQTEATARMGYLPPEDFQRCQGSIGRPIPGGEFSLRDAQGNTIERDDVEGELYYRGPNVMMGYAQSPGDLALAAETEELATGDIACRRGAYYFIKGRLKRFIKIAGHRINLDEVEQLWAADGLNLRAMGEDDALMIATQDGRAVADLPDRLAQRLQINPRYISVRVLSDFPQLASGKPDYRAMMSVFDHVA